MHSFSRDLAPLRLLALRALVGYPLLRALVLVIAALLVTFAGEGAGDGLESPIGVVILATAVGAADIRRRGESMLWANLGYPRVVTVGIFGVVALLGEILLAWVLP